MSPWLLAGRLPCGIPVLLAATVSVMWCITYPLIYHLSNRRSSSEYDNQMDIAMGLYLFGLMSAVFLALGSVPVAAAVIVGVIESVMRVLILSQWVYYLMYGECIGFSGMTIVQATNINEVIEFARSYNPFGVAAILLLLVAEAALPFAVNLVWGMGGFALPLWVMIAEGVAVVALLWLIFAGRKAPAKRCGIVALYRVILDYRRKNSLYTAEASRRMERLAVRPLVSDEPSPRTVVMVIGESANRDFMSAFTPLDRENTPWLSALKKSENTILFPNAYSCAM